MNRKLPLILILISVVALQACRTNVNGTWLNERIDPNVRATISVQNKKLFNALMTNDIPAFKQMLSPRLVQSLGSRADSMTKVTSTIGAKDFAILDEFYTKSAGDTSEIKIPTTRGDKYDYTLTYTGGSKEMYASVLISKGLPINCAILAVYAKIDNAWKLNVVQVGKYNILNEAAPDYFEDAQQQYKKGNLINAANFITMASELAHPAENFIQYKNEEQMKALFQKIMADANTQYHFPTVLEQVKTKPQIFAVLPQFVNDASHPGVCPLVKYKSLISIKDTVKLKAENLEMQSKISQTFKGITEGQHFIIYQAFNEIPNGQTPAQRYGFVQKIN